MYVDILENYENRKVPSLFWFITIAMSSRGTSESSPTCSRPICLFHLIVGRWMYLSYYLSCVVLSDGWLTFDSVRMQFFLNQIVNDCWLWMTSEILFNCSLPFSDVFIILVCSQNEHFWVLVSVCFQYYLHFDCIQTPQ